MTDKTISYFRVDSTLQKFERVYTRLLFADAHTIRVNIDGQICIISSDYDIKQMTYGNMILGFVYKGAGESVAKLYPLPETPDFTPEATIVNFPSVSEGEVQRQVYQNAEITALRKKQESKKIELADQVKRSNANAQWHVNLANSIKVPSKFYQNRSVNTISTTKENSSKTSSIENKKTPPNNISKKDMRPVSKKKWFQRKAKDDKTDKKSEKRLQKLFSEEI